MFKKIVLFSFLIACSNKFYSQCKPETIYNDLINNNSRYQKLVNNCKPSTYYFAYSSTDLMFVSFFSSMCNYNIAVISGVNESYCESSVAQYIFNYKDLNKLFEFGGYNSNEIYNIKKYIDNSQIMPDICIYYGHDGGISFLNFHTTQFISYDKDERSFENEYFIDYTDSKQDKKEKFEKINFYKIIKSRISEF